jgi:Protein of unknown function (DUF3147)
MGELVARFVIGGAVVSVFSLLGDVFKPKSFAGLFGAAPSVALATLALTLRRDGGDYAATEGRSMVAGALALGAYVWFVSWSIRRFRFHSLPVALAGLVLWLAIAFALWAALLR